MSGHAVIPPIKFRWDGDAMVPLTAMNATLADRHYTIGQEYRLVEEQERSQRSHNHLFAEIAEAHESLPERWAHRLPTPEHLRKYAIIKAGYCNTQIEPYETKADAERTARLIRPKDEFSLVTVDGTTVSIFTAQSISKKAMGAREFQKAKNAILDVIADMLGTTRDALVEAGMRPAA